MIRFKLALPFEKVADMLGRAKLGIEENIAKVVFEQNAALFDEASIAIEESLFGHSRVKHAHGIRMVLGQLRTPGRSMSAEIGGPPVGSPHLLVQRGKFAIPPPNGMFAIDDAIDDKRLAAFRALLGRVYRHGQLVGRHARLRFPKPIAKMAGKRTASGGRFPVTLHNLGGRGMRSG